MRREPRKRPPAPKSGSDEARANKRHRAAIHRGQIKQAKKKLRLFKPTLDEVAAYAVTIRRVAVEKSLELGGVVFPKRLRARIRTLVAAIESRGLPIRLRLVALGALGYFLLVGDVIPDMAPLGLADDLTVADIAAVALTRWRRSSRPRSRRRGDPDEEGSP